MVRGTSAYDTAPKLLYDESRYSIITMVSRYSSTLGAPLRVRRQEPGELHDPEAPGGSQKVTMPATSWDQNGAPV